MCVCVIFARDYTVCRSWKVDSICGYATKLDSYSSFPDFFLANYLSRPQLAFKVFCNEIKRILVRLLLLCLFLPILHITSYRKPMDSPRESPDYQFLTQILLHNLFHLIQIVFTHDVIFIPFENDARSSVDVFDVVEDEEGRVVGYHDVHAGSGARLGLGKEEGVARAIAVTDDGDLAGGGVGTDGLDVFLHKRPGDCLSRQSICLLVSIMSITGDVIIGGVRPRMLRRVVKTYQPRGA